MTGIEMTHGLPRLAAGADRCRRRTSSSVSATSRPRSALINEGKVRALGVSTKERVAPLPHLAPIADQGGRLRCGVVADGGGARGHAQGRHRAPARRDQGLHGAARDRSRSSRWACSVDTPSVANLQIFCPDRDRAMEQGRATSRYRRLAMTHGSAGAAIAVEPRRGRADAGHPEHAVTAPLLSMRG